MCRSISRGRCLQEHGQLTSGHTAQEHSPSSLWALSPSLIRVDFVNNTVSGGGSGNRHTEFQSQPVICPLLVPRVAIQPFHPSVSSCISSDFVTLFSRWGSALPTPNSAWHSWFCSFSGNYTSVTANTGKSSSFFIPISFLDLAEPPSAREGLQFCPHEWVHHRHWVFESSLSMSYITGSLPGFGWTQLSEWFWRWRLIETFMKVPHGS